MKEQKLRTGLVVVVRRRHDVFLQLFAPPGGDKQALLLSVLQGQQAPQAGEDPAESWQRRGPAGRERRPQAGGPGGRPGGDYDTCRNQEGEGIRGEHHELHAKHRRGQCPDVSRLDSVRSKRATFFGPSVCLMLRAPVGRCATDDEQGAEGEHAAAGADAG
eukprot:scaffold211794_cov30-Prasinocladus_malaysianus.AAC.1